MNVLPAYCAPILFAGAAAAYARSSIFDERGASGDLLIERADAFIA